MLTLINRSYQYLILSGLMHVQTYTRTVTQYEDINLQELCLNKLFSCLNDGDEVDRLPLPTRLKDKLREYFYV